MVNQSFQIQLKLPVGDQVGLRCGTPILSDVFARMSFRTQSIFI